jgi:hypothetical protein
LLWSVGEFKRAKNLREESSCTKNDPRCGNFGLDPLVFDNDLPVTGWFEIVELPVGEIPRAGSDRKTQQEWAEPIIRLKKQLDKPRKLTLTSPHS